MSLLGSSNCYVQLDPSTEGAVKLLLMDKRKRKLGSFKLPQEVEQTYLDLFGEDNIPRQAVMEYRKDDENNSVVKLIIEGLDG